MTELTPLLLSTTDDLERTLLRSADGDEPGENALPRAAAALGVSAAAISVVASVAVAEQAVLGGAAAVKPLTLLSLAKWLGVGVTAGVVASGGAHAAVVTVERYAAYEQREAALAAAPAPKNRGKGSARPAATAAVAAPEPTAIPAPPDLPEIELSPEPEVAALAPAPARALWPDSAATAAPPVLPPPAATAPAGPSVGSLPIDEPTVAAAPTAASTTAPPVASPRAAAPRAASSSEEAAFAAMALGRAHDKHSAWSMAEELKRLDSVREALRSRRAADAILYLDAYRKQFPAGAMRTEALVLRVEALLAAGNRAGAERQAEVLFRASPEGRHADRVRALLAR